MGSADIIREVERETAVEVEQLLGSADERSAALIEGAREAVRARVEAGVARAEPAVRADAGRRVNAARSRLNQRRVQLALDRTAAVNEAASARLEAIAAGAEGDRWPTALERLARESLDLAGPGVTVRVRQGDADVVRALVEATAGILVPLDGAAPAGVVVRSADGRLEIDASIPVRLGRARVRLAETVATHLGLVG